MGRDSGAGGGGREEEIDKDSSIIIFLLGWEERETGKIWGGLCNMYIVRVFAFSKTVNLARVFGAGFNTHKVLPISHADRTAGRRRALKVKFSIPIIHQLHPTWKDKGEKGQTTK